jgi:RHS repeat-associated protein
LEHRIDTFKYDPLGRRIEKSSSAAASVFAYDIDNLIEETNSSGAMVSRYTQTQNIDEPLSMLRSSVTSYYSVDGLGSVTSLTNSAGAAAETYTYDSFGKVTASSGSLVNPFQYTGRESDPETGLYYYRARYYDPSAGRFLSEDPIGFWAGGNFYRYVGNHSTDLVDPSGLLQVCCRPAHNGPAQFWADMSLKPPPCHCFLKLSDGTTLGGYHHNWPWSGTLGGLDLRRKDNSDQNKYANQASCTLVPGGCDGRAISAFNSSPKNLGGYGFGAGDYGTSNDAAAGLLKESGIGYTLPACAWGKGTGTIPEGPDLNPGGGFPFQFMP